MSMLLLSLGPKGVARQSPQRDVVRTAWVGGKRFITNGGVVRAACIGHQRMTAICRVVITAGVSAKARSPLAVL